MAFFLPQGPPPAFNASIRYQYHTPDGGPPNNGKPPTPAGAGPPPPYSPFPFCTNPPAPGVGFPFCAAPPNAPGPFAFCAPQPPAPNPNTFCCTTGPPAPPGGMMCWPTSRPPEAPKPLILTAAAPPAPPSRGLTVAGRASAPHPPDPGNRVNNRVVKADDGTGVLCAEEMTTFHVLNPGRWFDDNMTVSSLIKPRDFMVQHADSDWSVRRFIQRLGGIQTPRLSAAQVACSDSLICVEQWHEAGNGKFERGSNVFYNEDKAHMSLKSVGWGPEHGKAGQKPPVWIMLYPVRPPA
jgi:hypothetical protein